MVATSCCGFTFWYHRPDASWVQHPRLLSSVPHSCRTQPTLFYLSPTPSSPQGLSIPALIQPETTRAQTMRLHNTLNPTVQTAPAQIREYGRHLLIAFMTRSIRLWQVVCVDRAETERALFSLPLSAYVNHQHTTTHTACIHLQGNFKILFSTIICRELPQVQNAWTEKENFGTST